MLISFLLPVPMAYLLWKRISFNRKQKERSAIGDMGETMVSDVLKPYLHVNNLTIQTTRTVQIDHVVQMKTGGFLTIETKRWAGKISGKPTDRNIRVNGKKRLNPVVQASWQAKALSAKTSKGVRSIVVSTAGLQYGDDFSGKILTIPELRDFLEYHAIPATQDYRNWSIIRNLEKDDRNTGLYQKHMNTHEGKGRPGLQMFSALGAVEAGTLIPEAAVSHGLSMLPPHLVEHATTFMKTCIDSI